MMDETTFERMCDAAVQSRLARDPAFQHAENAEDQAEAEGRIEQEEYDRLVARFGLPGVDF